ncbi:hypothetical protein OAK18_03415 [Candidatus Pelagibacter sp.]|nr:hypothetical protein [Candidatus Pelagibacter sp.]
MINEEANNKKYTIIFLLIIIFLITSYIGYRSYHTKILPFQKIILECEMEGKQLFPSSGGAKYAPIVRFPKVFKIKFGFWDGEFLEGGDVLIKKHFLKNKIFGYQHSGKSLIIKPTYMPPWLLEGEPTGNSMWFEFPLVFNERPQLWLDYFWMGGLGEINDYDAFYKCKEFK